MFWHSVCSFFSFVHGGADETHAATYKSRLFYNEYHMYCSKELYQGNLCRRHSVWTTLFFFWYNKTSINSMSLNISFEISRMRMDNLALFIKFSLIKYEILNKQVTLKKIRAVITWKWLELLCFKTKPYTR